MKIPTTAKRGLAAALGAVTLMGALPATAGAVSVPTADLSKYAGVNIVNAEKYADRAMVAVPKDEGGVFVSWRLYEEDSAGITFTLKRGNEVVYTGATTSFTDEGGKAGDTYTLTATEGKDSTTAETAVAWNKEYVELQLNQPEPQTVPWRLKDATSKTDKYDEHTATHHANDMSVGDLDGDGELELIVKWQPDDTQDNYYGYFTGNTYIDGYDVDWNTGATTQLWRINMGTNIRSGAHYTQFQVWDYDGDGHAEIMVKAADGTTTYKAENGKLVQGDHVGAVSDDQIPVSAEPGVNEHDYRKGYDSNYRKWSESVSESQPNGDFNLLKGSKTGKIADNPEYLAVFDGADGSLLDYTDYVPEGDNVGWAPKNSSGNSNDNGINYRDRFLAGTAYLDGKTPSAIFARGYYFRTEVVAWQFDGEKLVQGGHFKADYGKAGASSGAHSLSIADVDDDGKDEIVYGSATIDDDMTLLFYTGEGHGDAFHVGDWNNDGELENFMVHEGKKSQTLNKADLQSGNSKGGKQSNFYRGGSYDDDNGRGLIADIDPTYDGAEFWSSKEKNLLNYGYKGNDERATVASNNKPASINFSLFWDGDLLSELQDHKYSSSSTGMGVPLIQKWNWETQTTEVLERFEGASTSNGTKGNAGIVGDILGDWRDEVIVRDANDNSKVRVYSTDYATEYSIPTGLQDRQYREGLAWQNTGYNQPANRPYLLSAIYGDFYGKGESSSASADLAAGYPKVYAGKDTTDAKNLLESVTKDGVIQVNVPTSAERFTVEAVAKDGEAKVYVNNKELATVDYRSLGFDTGKTEKDVTVKVVSSDGKTTKETKIHLVHTDDPLDTGTTVDKSKLQALYDSVKDLKQEDGPYTDESWANFVKQRDVAAARLADTTGKYTQTNIDASVKALTSRYELLEKVTTPEPEPDPDPTAVPVYAIDAGVRGEAESAWFKGVIEDNELRNDRADRSYLVSAGWGSLAGVKLASSEVDADASVEAQRDATGLVATGKTLRYRLRLAAGEYTLTAGAARFGSDRAMTLSVSGADSTADIVVDKDNETATGSVDFTVSKTATVTVTLTRTSGANPTLTWLQVTQPKQ